MKYLFTSGLILMSLMNIFSSCNFLVIDIKESPICVLTPDELSFMYTDKDSLPDEEVPYFYYGTLAFFQDSKDTILARVSTTVDHFGYFYDSNKNKKLNGHSHVDSFDKSWCEALEVQLYKEYADEPAEISININLNDKSYFTKKLDNPKDTTLVILGKTYHTVYIFYNPDSLSTDFKKVVFAKNFGFLKIELADGRTLERLDLSK